MKTLNFLSLQFPVLENASVSFTSSSVDGSVSFSSFELDDVSTLCGKLSRRLRKIFHVFLVKREKHLRSIKSDLYAVETNA